MKNIDIFNDTHSLEAPLQVSRCASFWCHLRGLTFRRKISDDQGLLLVYSQESILDSAIHMFGVFFDLGIIWINGSGVVVDKCLAKRWFTIKIPRRPARYVLEIVPERLIEFNIGDRISFEQTQIN